MNNDNTDYKNVLLEGLIQTGVQETHNSEICDKLLKYMDLVLETNKSMNLTAITEPADFVVKHFIDSFSLCNSEVFKSSDCIIDVGTGAGFPGIPLAIAFPEKEFLLMDSLNKRIKFLENVAETLDLKNVSCCHARAEDLGNSPDHREKFDLCVSRAVARLSVLSEYCLPLVKPGGYFVAYKTQGEDLSEGSRAVKTLGGKLEHIDAFPKLTGILDFIELEHNLVYIRKIKNTPKQYPRKSGLPGKNPL